MTPYGVPSRKRFLAAAAGFVGSGYARAARAATALRIGTLPIDQTGEPFYAADAGLFEEAGIEATVSILNNGPAIASAIAGGALDIGYSNGVTLAIAHAHGLPFRIVFPANLYIAKTPLEGLLSVAKASPIRKASDFNGRSIGVGGLNTNVPLCARLWIDENGGDSSTVRFVEVPFAEMLEAVRTQRVDGGQLTIQGDPELGKPLDPLRIVADTYSTLGREYPSGFWFTSSAFAAKNADTIQRFAAAMRQTAVWAATHHRRSAAILARFVHQSVERIEAIPRVSYGTTLTPATIQPAVDVAARYGLIPKSFPAAQLLTSA